MVIMGLWELPFLSFPVVVDVALHLPSSKALLPKLPAQRRRLSPPGSLSIIQPLTNRILAGKGSLVRNVKSGFFLKQGPTLL